MLQIGKLRKVVCFFVLTDNLSLGDEWLETLVEVVHANAGIDDGKDDEYDGQYCENRKRRAGGVIL